MNGSTTDTHPLLSAVVVSFNGASATEACVVALRKQEPDAGRLEIIVVYDPAGRSANVSPRLESEYRDVRWMPVKGGVVPRMRAVGMRASRGQLIALLEDDCVVDAGWFDGALAAHQSRHIVIGGAVEPGPYHRALDWAVYFCEYGRFMRPVLRQQNLALALAGNNVVYKRAALDHLPPGANHAFYDIFIHQGWQDAGLPMAVEETLVIRNVNSWSLKHVTSVPFHHGRAFAGQRISGTGVPRRLALGVLALGLPLLKTARVVGGILTRRRLARQLCQALPWILVFMSSWSIGEAIGYMTGPGNSAERWR